MHHSQITAHDIITGTGRFLAVFLFVHFTLEWLGTFVPLLWVPAVAYGAINLPGPVHDFLSLNLEFPIFILLLVAMVMFGAIRLYQIVRR